MNRKTAIQIVKHTIKARTERSRYLKALAKTCDGTSVVDEDRWWLAVSDKWLVQQAARQMRPDSRMLYLAYAFLRGRPYQQVERGGTPPHYKPVKEALSNTIGGSLHPVRAWSFRELMAWLEEGTLKEALAA